MPDTPDATLRKIKRFARDPATGKGITVPGNMSYQEWYGKYVENVEKSGILKSASVSYIPVTQSAIDNVPVIQPSGWSTEQAETLQAAHKELLRCAQNVPLGDEVGAALRMDGTEIQKITGQSGSVSIPDYDAEYIAIHTHPDGLTFSGADIELFIMRDQLQILTAVGNDGSVYAIQKMENYAAADLVKAYMEIENEYPHMMDDPISYALSMASFLKEAEKYGIRYFEGRT
jgi:hypothetical protein